MPFKVDFLFEERHTYFTLKGFRHAQITNSTFKWLISSMNWRNMFIQVAVFQKNWIHKLHIWKFFYLHELMKNVDSFYFFEKNCSHKLHIWMAFNLHELIKYASLRWLFVGSETYKFHTIVTPAITKHAILLTFTPCIKAFPLTITFWHSLAISFTFLFGWGSNVVLILTGISVISIKSFKTLEWMKMF